MWHQRHKKARQRLVWALPGTFKWSLQMSQYDGHTPKTTLTSFRQRAADLAVKINDEHLQAHRDAQSAISHALNAGELLIQARTEVPHGGWAEWLAANVVFSERTARSYMELARNKGELASKETDGLSVRGALKLLADSREPAPGRLDKAPMAHFDEFTFLGHDRKHVEAIFDLMAPWMERGYIPLIDFDKSVGWIWHTLLTPDGLCSRKQIAAKFADPDDDGAALEAAA
jgi:hypothetical protein